MKDETRNSGWNKKAEAKKQYAFTREINKNVICDLIYVEASTMNIYHVYVISN